MLIYLQLTLIKIKKIFKKDTDLTCIHAPAQKSNMAESESNDLMEFQEVDIFIEAMCSKVDWMDMTFPITDEPARDRVIQFVRQNSQPSNEERYVQLLRASAQWSDLLLPLKQEVSTSEDSTPKEFLLKLYNYVKRDKKLHDILQKKIQKLYQNNKADDDKIISFEKPQVSLFQLAKRLIVELEMLKDHPDEKNKINLYNEITSTLESILSINKELTKSLQDEDAERQGLEAQNEKLKEEQNRLHNIITSLSEQQLHTDEEKTKLTQSNTEAKAQITKMEKEIQQLTQQLQSSNLKNQELIEEFHSRINENNAALKSSEKQMKKIASESAALLKQFTDKLEKAEKNLEKAGKVIEMYDIKVKELTHEDQTRPSSVSTASKTRPLLSAKFLSPRHEKTKPVPAPRLSLPMSTQLLQSSKLPNPGTEDLLLVREASTKSLPSTIKPCEIPKSARKSEILKLRDSVEHKVSNGNLHNLYAFSFDPQQLSTQKDFKDNPVKYLKKTHPCLKDGDNFIYTFLSTNLKGEPDFTTAAYSKNKRGTYSYNVTNVLLAMQMKHVLEKHQCRNFMFCLLRKQKSSETKVTDSDIASVMDMTGKLLEKIETITEEIVTEAV